MTTTALAQLKALNDAEAIIHKHAAIYAEPPRMIIVDTELLESAAGVLQELQAAMGSDAITRKAMDSLTTDAQAIYEGITRILEDPTTPKTAMGAIEKWVAIDTHYWTPKHQVQTRHLATIHDQGCEAHTKCIKRITRFMTTRHLDGFPTSYYYTDGSLFTKPCPICLPEDHADWKAGKPLETDRLP